MGQTKWKRTRKKKGFSSLGALVALRHGSHIDCLILNKQISLFAHKKDKLGVCEGSAVMSNTESWEMVVG